ncbi:hypothetical protein BC332_31674 [Capsicum chinense]|nr:hypothetical protein BC332_31674 [Capsicum chinense]
MTSASQILDGENMGALPLSISDLQSCHSLTIREGFQWVDELCANIFTCTSGEGYFVLNDVFHFVNEEGSELAQAPVVSQNNLDAQPISSNPLAEPPDAKPALLEAFNSEYTERRQKAVPALLNACDVLANVHFMSVILLHLLLPFVL